MAQGKLAHISICRPLRIIYACNNQSTAQCYGDWRVEIWCSSLLPRHGMSWGKQWRGACGESVHECLRRAWTSAPTSCCTHAAASRHIHIKSTPLPWSDLSKINTRPLKVLRMLLGLGYHGKLLLAMCNSSPNSVLTNLWKWRSWCATWRLQAAHWVYASSMTYTTGVGGMA